MNQELLFKFVSEISKEAVLSDNKQFTEIIVPKEKLHEVAAALKSSPETQFDYLICQTGVDINEKLGVVYHMQSTTLRHIVVLKVFAEGRETPVIDTVSDIWRSAEYFEREIYDLLGIQFANHPDLRRLFLEDDFVGFPLRKDFADDVNIIQK
jgi:NADH:ubiquinone oxidoreductase subunit C